MRIRGTHPAPLDPTTLTLLIHGPWSVGLNQLTMPNDDVLRQLWQQHEATVRAAAAQEGVAEPWVQSRVWFVDLIDRL